MAVTIQSNLIYPIADFPNTVVNPQILSEEFDSNGAIAVTVNNINQQGSNVHCLFDGLIEETEVTAADAVVAAHQGEPFDSPVTREASEGVSSDSSDGWISKLILQTGPLAAGFYRLNATCEHSVATESAGNATDIQVLLSTSSLTDFQSDSDHSRYEEYSKFAAGSPFEVVDGETIKLEIQFRSVNGVTARCRRARLAVSPAEE